MFKAAMIILNVELTIRFRVIHQLMIINKGNSHPIGTLSEQLDKNSTPVNSTPSWDPEISKLSIASTSIDEEILRDFMHEFKSRTGQLLSVRNLVLADEGFAHLSNHLPVKIYEFSMNPLLYQIRVELAPEFVKNSNPQLLTLNPKGKIMKQVTRLIEWLLYINSAVLRNLNATENISNNGKLLTCYWEV
ncbi:hypothetical protein VP01_2769g4 [Puccinia sorghi]|uniref:Uncharacterized protein n=1 Tax=Puccinia sorghi TaxID=27349 RepID=A0A0L6V2W8_9BASI|nr:hypothetical protein VP01_2769g4 [Puccinia sorghi]